jgi:Fe-S oxidoreductase
VVVWPDTFTDTFRPEVGNDVLLAMGALGERVAVPSGWACCGRTMYDFGMLDLARHSLKRLLKVLGPWVEAGVPVVVAEPSCLAAFREELPRLLADDPRSAKLASLARSPAEHLVANGHTARLAGAGPQGDVGRAVVHGHCHQKAVVGTDADQVVLAALGYEVEVLDAGCCGLAGSFGFDARHEPVSRTIGEDLWLPKVRAALGQGDGAVAQLVVDGFSCHTQLEHLGPDLLPRATTIPALVRSHQAGPKRPVARRKP